MVVVTNPNAAIGCIKQTYPGQDGLEKVVDVRVKDKVLKQPITRISPVEIQDI